MNIGSTMFSFRAESKDIELLEKLAKQHNMKPSAMMSHILKSYLEWDFISCKVGMIPLQKETAKDLIDSVGDSEMEDLVTRAADKFMDKLLVITGRNDLDSFLQITRIRLAKSGFALSESIENGTLQLVIKHGMGLKWSIFFGKYHERIIRKFGYDTELEIRDDLWIIRINKQL